MKEILLLEDNGLIWDAFKEREKDYGDIKLYTAFQISDAMDLFEYHKDTIDWLIVDLNVPCTGLTREETDASERNLITGWIWLKNYVYPKHPQFKKRTIIFSAHIKEMEEHADMKQIHSDGILIMPKAKFTPTDIIHKINQGA